MFIAFWGRIFASHEKIFVFKYWQTKSNLVFTWNIYRKRVTRTFWMHYFGRQYRSSGSKIHLDAALIWIQVCIYVVMFVLPRSDNPRQRCFNNEAFQLIQKDPNIVSQEISLFGAYDKFGQSLPQNYETLFFMFGSNHFFKTFYHDDTQIYQISVHGQVEVSACEGDCKFCYRINF